MSHTLFQPFPSDLQACQVMFSYLLLILELDLDEGLMRLDREHQVVLVEVEAVLGADDGGWLGNAWEE